MQATISTNQEREYNLACYYLITNGYDTHDNSQATPDNWWSTYDLDLGAAVGGRYTWNGLFRRDFANGMVLVNEPGASSATVSIGSGFTNTNSQVIRRITFF